jgi:hypothetical protein
MLRPRSWLAAAVLTAVAMLTLFTAACGDDKAQAHFALDSDYLAAD